MLRLQRYFTLFTRGCHHITKRDRQIAQLYRELGEYHLRDNILHQHNLLNEIHKLENQTQLDNNHLEDSINEPINEPINDNTI